MDVDATVDATVLGQMDGLDRCFALQRESARGGAVKPEAIRGFGL